MARQRHRDTEHFSTHQFASVHSVDESGPKAMTFQSTQGSASDVPAESRPLAVTKLAELQELFAQRGDIRVIRRQGLTKRDRDPVRKCLRKFRKEAPAPVGKD